MIIGILSDAHGNIYGLQECLHLLEQANADRIFFLGDAVDYFSRSREVLGLLKHKKVTCVKGNHENLLLTGNETSSDAREIYNLDHTISTLQPEDYAYMASWEDSIELALDGVRVLMVHGSPFDNLEEYVYPDSDLSRFLDLEYDVILMGHTHIPFVYDKGGKTIVNAGSAGFRRDDGRFLSCAVLDSVKRHVRILKSSFPATHMDSLKPFHADIHRVLERRADYRSKLLER